MQRQRDARLMDAVMMMMMMMRIIMIIDASAVAADAAADAAAASSGGCGGGDDHGFGIQDAGKRNDFIDVGNGERLGETDAGTRGGRRSHCWGVNRL